MQARLFSPSKEMARYTFHGVLINFEQHQLSTIIIFTAPTWPQAVVAVLTHHNQVFG
jgi:hypothetical protein